MMMDSMCNNSTPNSNFTSERIDLLGTILGPSPSCLFVPLIAGWDMRRENSGLRSGGFFLQFGIAMILTMVQYRIAWGSLLWSGMVWWGSFLRNCSHHFETTAGLLLHFSRHLKRLKLLLHYFTSHLFSSVADLLLSSDEYSCHPPNSQLCASLAVCGSFPHYPLWL